MPGLADSVGSFAGAAGVGALCLLGVFLLLDGRAPSLFPTFEQYSKTSTWSIVAAIPVLALAYVIGLVFITAASFAVRGAFGPSLAEEITDTRTVSSIAHKDSVLAQTYLQLRQERDVLGGAALALLILAVGAWSEIANLRHLKAVILVGGLAALVVSVALFWAAGTRASQAHSYASEPTGGS